MVLPGAPKGERCTSRGRSPRCCEAYDYDVKTGTPSNKRVFGAIKFEQKSGDPDGASVDATGLYWCALCATHALRRLDPNGRIEPLRPYAR